MPIDPLALDLTFGGPYAPPNPLVVDLILGPVAGSPGSTVDTTLSTTVRVAAALTVADSNDASIAATIRVAGSLFVTVAPPLVRLTNDAGLAWGRAAAPANFQARALPFRQGETLSASVAQAWAPIRPAVQADKRALWRQTVRLSGPPATATWRQAAGVQAACTFPWSGRVLLRSPPVTASWHQGVRVDAQSGGSWRQAVSLRVTASGGWRAAVAINLPHRSPWHSGLPNHPSDRLPWRQGRGLNTYGAPFTPYQPPVEPPEQLQTDLCFCIPLRDLDRNPLALDLVLGVDPCGDIDNGTTIVVPIRRVYEVINEVSLTRVGTTVAIDASSISMAIDADSFAWSFRASIPAEQQASVEPGVDGAPAELALVINGMPFRVLVESIARDRSFASSKVSVTGRSKTALLAAPFAPVLTFANASDLTAQQLVADALSYNGVPLDWTVDWTLTDWLVPAGVWNFRGTHIDAVSRIAQAAGAYLRPHPADQQIAVLARYPSVPWEWATMVTPDYELPAAVTTREGIEWRDLPDYNSVYVSGVSTGPLGYVRKTGSAGDVFADMVTDPLITHVDAARQRGVSILGATGRKALVSLRLPVLPETGVIEPGRFVNYVDGAVERVGLVRSTAVDVSFPNVFQTLGVEVHVS